MLEITNGLLLVYFLVLSSISTLAPILVKPIIACFARPTKTERAIFTNIQKLKSEQKGISMKDEFAAYSKIQRKINKLESELKDASQSRMTKSLAVKSTIQIVLQVAITIITILSVIYFRKDPIVVFKGDLFPLATPLGYPSQIPNAISTHNWVIISNFSLRTLLKPVLS